MMPREKWTDERLDDLNKKVDDGFARVDRDLREIRADLNREVGGLRSEMNGRFDKLNDSVNARFDAQNRNLIVAAAAIIAALIGVNVF